MTLTAVPDAKLLSSDSISAPVKRYVNVLLPKPALTVVTVYDPTAAAGVDAEKKRRMLRVTPAGGAAIVPVRTMVSPARFGVAVRPVIAAVDCCAILIGAISVVPPP